MNQSETQAVQVACISVIELPFRTSLGGYFRFSLAPNKSVEVAGLNRILLPRKRPMRVDELPRVSQRALQNTRVAVIEYPCERPVEDVSAIREVDAFPLTTEAADLLRVAPGPQLLLFPPYDRHANILRRFVELYFLSCRPITQSHGIRPLWRQDFLGGHIVFATCILPPGGSVPDSFLRTLLRSENIRDSEADMSAVWNIDVLPAEKRRLRRALRDELPTLSDQLWLMSDSYTSDGNLEMGIITAVAALEAAVSVFARRELEPKLGRKLTSDLLRDQGMFVMIQALPKLFFKSQAAPSDDVVKDVLSAIEARNALMHGKHDKDGNPVFYKLRGLGKAISGCRSLLNCFDRELGRAPYIDPTERLRRRKPEVRSEEASG